MQKRFAFSSDTVLVEDCTIENDDAVVVVTFPTAHENAGFTATFGKDFLQKSQISALHFTTAESNWFQESEMEAALAAVRAITGHFKRVVTFGQSMGGYGAALCSIALGAHAIFALAPQYSLDRAKAPWELRWANHAARILSQNGFQMDDMRNLMAHDAELYLVYDPLTVDRQHAEALLALSDKAFPFPIVFGGHPISKWLAEARLLSPLALDVIKGNVDKRDWRNRVRSSRRTHSQWWLHLARTARKSKRYRLSILASHRSLSINPRDIRAMHCLAQTWPILRMNDEALAILPDFISRHPADGTLRLAYSNALQVFGKMDEAIIEARAAIEFAPKNRNAHLALSRLLLATDRHGEALQALDGFTNCGGSLAEADLIRQQISDHLSGISSF